MDSTRQTMKDIRKEIFLTGYSAQNAHLASAFSLVEVLWALYLGGVLRHDPLRPDWPERDRLILSKGHGSLALYSVLRRAGYFDEQTLRSFCKPGSVLGGEPCALHIPGVEASTGSLGHGLSLGVGMAIAGKMDGRPGRVYVILGDGECEEGSVWEAVLSAAALKLDNLTAIIDANRLQKMGTLHDIIGLSDWGGRFAAFGWHVLDADGHDAADVQRACMERGRAGQPAVVIAHTVKGKGLSLMENNPDWHWRLPNRRELKVFMAELDITQEEIRQCRERT